MEPLEPRGPRETQAPLDPTETRVFKDLLGQLELLVQRETLEIWDLPESTEQRVTQAPQVPLAPLENRE